MNPIVKEILIYPVKSLGGYTTEKAFVQRRGFQFDRRWMIIDESCKFLTQRELPNMALLNASIVEDYLVLGVKSRDSDKIRLPLKPEGEKLEVQVWKDRVNAIGYSRLADEWLSDHLGLKCRLVHMPDSSNRIIDQAYGQHDDIVSFADGYPFLILSENSVNDLNSRLENPLPMNRFRPNIVVGGCGAFSEDTWNQIVINGIKFRLPKLCERCVIPTTDQETGLRGPEPLRTFAKFRKKEGKIMFGKNAIAYSQGWIKIGDQVEVLIGE